jgi:nicotinamide riboside kinase
MTKVGVTGAHGTGKTTLVCVVAEAINKPFIREVARECPLPINEAATYETQKWILRHQIMKEMEHLGEWVLTDRTSLDNLAYLYYLENIGRVNDQQLADYENIALPWGETYDMLFYVPIEFPLVDDGVRATSPRYQKDIDENIKMILDGEGYEYVTLKGSVEERKATMLKAMDALR